MVIIYEATTTTTTIRNSVHLGRMWLQIVGVPMKKQFNEIVFDDVNNIENDTQTHNMQHELKRDDDNGTMSSILYV